MANSTQQTSHDDVKQCFWDILEHYSVRTSTNCLTFDELAEQLGGLYSNHEFVEKKYSDKIYETCRKEWQRNVQNPKVKTYHSKEVQTTKYRYIIHLCRTPGFEEQRERMQLDAVFNTNVLAKGIGYCRVFSFPCKLILNILKHY